MVKISSFQLLRVIALVAGFLPAAFFLVFLVGEGLAELIDGKYAVIPILSLMLLAVSGYILAWKRPKAGGLIMMAGGFIMGIYLLITSGFQDFIMAAVYGLPFIAPGSLLFFLDKFKKTID
jgi:hypothetical protein